MLATVVWFEGVCRALLVLVAASLQVPAHAPSRTPAAQVAVAPTPASPARAR